MATSDSVKADLERRPEAGAAVPTANAFSIVEQMKPEFAKVLPAILTPDRFLRVTLTTLRTNPNLLGCSRESLLGALMTSAQLGLEPGSPLGHAYLVPYGKECTFILGYKGMIDLAYRSGRVSIIKAGTVHEADEFDYEDGLEPALRHRAELRGKRGASYAWWAAAKLVNGGSAFVVLGREDVEQVRTRSKAKDSGPWRTDYDSMARKTAIRQLSKYMPMSTELALANAVDESVRQDLSADALDAQAYTAGSAEDPFAA